MKTLLLIDANSIIHRSFHALPTLTTPAGQPIQAVYGLSSILLKLWREEKPDYAAALFDRPEPTFRKEKYEEYKAQRPEAPNELISQIIEAHNLFEKFGIKTFEKAGLEADDLIATLAEKFKSEPDLKIIILTGDLDTLQLVKDGKILVRTFRKGVSDTMIYDENAVRERYGLEPDQLVDYKALVGDPSDNIKGVPGIGPKTATELIKRFGSLDNIYKNLDKDPKLKKRLGPFRKEAELSRHLVTLERNAPVDVSMLDELKIEKEQPALRDYFKRLGFETLIKRLDGNNSKKADPKASQKKIQAQIFALQEKPEPKVKPELEEEPLFIEESSGAKGYSNDYLSLKLKVGFGLKPLLKELWAKNKDLAPPYFDLGVAFWILDPDFKNYAPEAVFKKFLRQEWSGGEEDLKKAFEFSSQKLKEYELQGVFKDIEMPLVPILAEMEKTGIGISSERLKLLESKINKKLSDLAREIYALAGGEFNINSPQKVSAIIFDKLKLGAGRSSKTKTGLRSTKAANLEELRNEHKIVGRILDYRESFKVLTTYVEPLQKLIGHDGRLHTEFVQTGTATGRLSSKSPNLQNIPHESIWAEELRSAFAARDGFSLAAFDYSQLELRILAALSGDPKMLQAFHKGLDIHQVTASKILGIPLSDVKDKERRLAKTLNFGLIYGMGASAFAKTGGISQGEAQEFIDAYFKEFSLIKKWQEKIKSDARTFGYVQTLTGRRRYFFEIVSDVPRIVAEAERAAINHPVQGFGADIIKMSMIKTRDALREAGFFGKEVKMVLSIHDELLFEVRDDMIEKTSRKIKEIMEEIYKLPIPLRVEVATGKDWGRLKEISIN